MLPQIWASNGKPQTCVGAQHCRDAASALCRGRADRLVAAQWQLACGFREAAELPRRASRVSVAARLGSSGSILWKAADMIPSHQWP